MNIDVRVLLAAGERALRSDDRAGAREAFLEAGQAASSYQLWRTALRCYRLAFELDVVDREPITRILQLPARSVFARPADTAMYADWQVYAGVLERHTWPSFGCRSAQIVTGGQRSRVECPGIGEVMGLVMPADDLIETRPDPRLAGMPLAMAMVILRRAMWIAPRDHASSPQRLRVAFDGLPPVWLDELGDWELAGGAPAR